MICEAFFEIGHMAGYIRKSLPTAVHRYAVDQIASMSKASSILKA